MTNDVRDSKQKEVVDLYVNKDLLRCSLVLSTGFGKSKVAIEIIKRLDYKKVTILVNSTDLRDFSWKAEFIKFGLEEFYTNNVQVVTYQTAYKWTAEEHDLSEHLIFADEIDFAADVPAFSQFFYTYHDCKILGLTGFITDAKKDWFATHLPVLYTYTAQNAQQEGLLNSLEFIFVKYELSRNPKDRVVEYTKQGVKKSFTQSDNNAYEYQDKLFRTLIGKKASLDRKYNNGDIDFPAYEKELNSLNYKIKRVVSARTEILFESKESVTMCKKIVQHFKDASMYNKIVVFSKRTGQSAAICDDVYNGTVGKKKLPEIMRKFNSGEIRALGVCDKINRGNNIDNLNIALLETFYGSDTKAAQRFGRLMRLRPEEVAKVIIMLPYYLVKNKDNTYSSRETQQCSWARSMLRSTNVVNSRVWDYRTIKD